MKLKINVLAVLLMLIPAGFSIAEQWITYTKENSGLESNEVTAICIDGLDAKWFGTKNGLTRFDGTSWTTYTIADSLAGNQISSIAFESTSYGPEIWIGTDNGVSVVSVVPDAITFATPYRNDNTGLISNNVYAVAVDTGHVKWFGTDSGVSSFDGDNWMSYTTRNILSENVVRSIAAALDGWIYFGTEGAGVDRFDGVTSASPYDTDWSGIFSGNVYAAYVDPEGVQWFGTDDGLSRHVGTETKENWILYTIDQGLAGNYIYSITGDPDGGLWVGTESGASYFDGSVWKSYTVDDGLAGNTVYAVASDRWGNIWFGTNNGVTKYTRDIVSVETPVAVPGEFAINGVFPNPFNLRTSIMFTLPEEGFVELSVFNLSGQKICTLISGTMTAGVHTGLSGTAVMITVRPFHPACLLHALAWEHGYRRAIWCW